MTAIVGGGAAGSDLRRVPANMGRVTTPRGWWFGGPSAHTGREVAYGVPRDTVVRKDPPMSQAPDLMPLLSRGRHRSAKKGACFMEMASYLAGEKWSDHPACTHPLLAQLARDVNDHLGDHARARIAPLIPDVVDLRPTDPRINASIAREAALAALPIASAQRQRVAAVGLLRCEQVLNELDQRPSDHLSQVARTALDDVPCARDWAHRFTGIGCGSRRTFASRSAPTIIRSAVAGIDSAAVPDPDDVLVELLQRTVALCRNADPREHAAQRRVLLRQP